MVQALGVHTVFTGYLEGVDGTVPRGTCLVLNTAGTKWRVGSTANKAAANRLCGCLAYTAGDDDNTAVEVMFCGVVSAEISGLDDGDAGPIRVSSTGTIERIASPTVDDEVIGRCDTDGVCYINFATQAEILAAGQPPADPVNALQKQSNAGGAFACVGVSASECWINPNGTNTLRAPSGAKLEVVRSGVTTELISHSFGGGSDNVLINYGATAADYVFGWATKSLAFETGASVSGSINNALWQTFGVGGHADWAARAAACAGPNLVMYNGVTSVKEGMLGGGNGGIIAIPTATTAPTGNPSSPGAAVVWGDASTFAVLARNRSGDIRDLFYGRELVNSTTGTQSNLATSASGVEYNTATFTGATSTITGFAGGRAGRSINIHVATGAVTTFAKDVTSTAANRFLTGTGANVAVTGPARLTASYDVNASRWILGNDSATPDVGVELVSSATGTQNDLTTYNGSGEEIDHYHFEQAGTLTITGLTGGRAGRSLTISSSGPSVIIVLKPLNGGSSSDNQFYTPYDADFTFAYGVVELIYDAAFSAWRVKHAPPLLEDDLSQAVAGSNIALSATQSNAGRLTLTGTPGATRTITWDAAGIPPAGKIRRMTVRNETDTNQTLTIGSGTTYSIRFKQAALHDPPGANARFSVDLIITSSGIFAADDWSASS